MMKNYLPVLASLLFTFAYAAQADMPVNGQITNTASASFKDATSASHTVHSNTVDATPYRVAGVAMAAGVSKNVAAGERVMFPLSVTNTGDSLDTFKISEVNSGTFSMDTVAFYACAGLQGISNNAKPIISTVDVAPGATFCFVAYATAPHTAIVGNTNTMVITATSTRTGVVKGTSTNNSTIGPDLLSQLSANASLP